MATSSVGAPVFMNGSPLEVYEEVYFVFISSREKDFMGVCLTNFQSFSSYGPF